MTKSPKHKIRIIGGEWRSRLISVADVPNLRPTPNRVRETLFNWLQTKIKGAQVLDAFCGSGALSLEALSRGSSQVLALDIAAKAINNLQTNLITLEAKNYQLIQIDALEFLSQNAMQKFDLVLLDPPFNLPVLAECLELLITNNWLAQNALIYVESGESLVNLPLPQNLSIYRTKQTGEVYYGLLQFALTN